MSELTALGIDLALRHGSCVQVELKGRKLIAWRVDAWDSEIFPDDTIGAKATISQMIGFSVIRLMKSLDLYPDALPIGIDWDGSDVFWGSRTSAIRKSFVAGFIASRITSRAFPLFFIPPSFVRHQIGLKSKANKREVMLQYLKKFRFTWASKIEPTEDDLDSVVLGYLAILLEQKKINL